VPRLRWALLEDFEALQEVAFNCPQLAWVGVSGTDASVRVSSRCNCPLMGCGEAELATDGTLRESSLHNADRAFVPVKDGVHNDERLCIRCSFCFRTKWS